MELIGINSYFDCEFPRYPREEIWYPHPINDLECNSVGLIRIRSTKSFMEKWDRNASFTTRCAFECYNNCTLNSRLFITHKNFNPLDNTKENLVPLSQDRKWKELRSLFINNTVQEMFIRERAWKEDSLIYFQLLGIPKTYILAWEKLKQKKIKKVK